MSAYFNDEWIFTVDGRATTVKAGQIVKMFDGAYCHAVILGFDQEGRAALARPYCYASGTGTTCPSPLTGVERIDCVDLNFYLNNGSAVMFSENFDLTR